MSPAEKSSTESEGRQRQPMRMILFVDDDKNILRGIERTLRMKKQKWHLRYANDSAEAISILAQYPIDIAIVDLQMPGMNGQRLLEKMTMDYQETLRIVLSGESKKFDLEQLLLLTDDILIKPCSAKNILRRLERFCDILDNWGLPAVRKLVPRWKGLGLAPAKFEELKAKICNKELSIPEKEKVIFSDMALTMMMLRLANSSYYKTPLIINNDSTPLMTRLGPDIPKHLMTARDVFPPLSPEMLKVFNPDTLWKQSLKTAKMAKKIAEVEKYPFDIIDEAFTGGLLYKVGRYVMATHFGDIYQQALPKIRDDKFYDWRKEKEELGISHNMVGAYFAGVWGLPKNVIDIIAYHTEPHRHPVQEISALTLVHVAHFLIEEADSGITRNLDTKYIENLGIENKIAQWRSIVNPSMIL